MVPSAGARAGNADGVETTRVGISNFDSHLEDGETLTSPTRTSLQSSNRQSLSPKT